MTTLYLLHYNNYYNRIVKREETIEDYAPYVLGTLQNTNFNPNDGVAAEHIFNWEGDTPDYILAENNDDGSFTRWFVIESARLRGGQYKISLYRDTVADYYDEVMGSTCLVERGYVSNTSPLIFNNEMVGFNQVKKSETLIKNNLETPWVICYLSRYNGEGNYNTFEGSFNNLGEVSADYNLTTLSQYKYYHWSYGPEEGGYTYPNNTNQITFSIRYRLRGQPGFRTLYFTSSGYEITGNPNGGSDPSLPIIDADPSFRQSGVREQWKYLLQLYESYSSNQYNLPINSITGVGTSEGAEKLLGEINKTISYTSPNTNVVRVAYESESTTIPMHHDVPKTSNLYAEMLLSMVEEPGMEFDPDTVNIHAQMHFEDTSCTVMWLYYENTTSETYTYNFGYTDGASTRDSVYEIIATPYNNTEFTIGTSTFNHSGAVGLQWFQDIINRYNAAGFAYDIQLVPYCPVDYTNITNENLIYCKRGEQNISVGIKLKEASFSKRYNVNVKYNPEPKISNETELFRIVSPNGVGEYEFSPSKNGGFSSVDIDCTLIPFNPYIKINPVFSYLYGNDYNDFRGLICGGDFSLPILNNSWSTYELNNKYYQQIFNRNIESQEYNNKWNLANNIVGSIAGTGSGAASGALAGSAVGSAGVGAVVGGAASLVGGIMDVVGNQKIFREGIDRQKDVFNMELGSIKARAQSLTRGTSYNINNKYFPYIEYFTCTEEELEAFQKKLEYTGMTVGVIGKTEDYINHQQTTYFKGQLIEIDITDDSHMAMEIAKNLQGGLRFYAD